MSSDPTKSLLTTNLCNDRFAFTTDKYDMFSLCFHSVVPSNMRGGRHEVSLVHTEPRPRRFVCQVFLQTKHGVEAKNYEDMGDAAKLKPLEVSLTQSRSCHLLDM